jgi:hypothetical protein
MYLNTTLVQNASKDNGDPSNLTLDLSLKQLLSLKNLEKLVDSSSLRKLLVSTNYLKEIESVINQFSNLTELDLSINHITRIENLYNLPNLKYLNLSNNRILKIEGLANLHNLEILVRNILPLLTGIGSQYELYPQNRKSQKSKLEDLNIVWE